MWAQRSVMRFMVFSFLAVVFIEEYRIAGIQQGFSGRLCGVAGYSARRCTGRPGLVMFEGFGADAAAVEQ